MPGATTDRKHKSLFSSLGAELPSVKSASKQVSPYAGKLAEMDRNLKAAERRAARAKDVSRAISSPRKNPISAESPFSSIFELVPQKLYIAFHPSLSFTKSEINRRPDLFFFSSDLHERYVPFCKDFGPVSCSILYRFVRYLRSKERNPGLQRRPLVYYTDLDPKNHANAAVLLGAYMMLEHKRTAACAASAFERTPYFPFPHFCDATHHESDFGISLEDCLRGLDRALSLRWFSMEDFDLDRFEHLEQPSTGDLSLVGHKFVAFRGPRDEAEDDDQCVFPASFYAAALADLGVTAVVRLNERETYDKSSFERVGIQVFDLEFADCTCPSPSLIQRFLNVVDDTPGRVAVHCRAGLGRTGTMIGLWMMKTMGFTAREAIAWLRLCRPGSVIGPQQRFLVACQDMSWEGNRIIPSFHRSNSEPVDLHHRPSDLASVRRSLSESESVASGAATPVSSSGGSAPIAGVVKRKLKSSFRLGWGGGGGSAEEAKDLASKLDHASRHRLATLRGLLPLRSNGDD